MTDQNQAPERYTLCDRHLSEGGGGYMEQDALGDYVTYYDYEALAKQRDELAAKLKYHQHEVVDTLEANEADAVARAEKAEAERDQALAASAAREIAMRDRAAAEASKRYKQWKQGGPVECDFTACRDIAEAIRALPLSPDGQQALADAWHSGYRAREQGKSWDKNPHRESGVST